MASKRVFVIIGSSNATMIEEADPSNTVFENVALINNSKSGANVFFNNKDSILNQILSE